VRQPLRRRRRGKDQADDATRPETDAAGAPGPELAQVWDRVPAEQPFPGDTDDLVDANDRMPVTEPDDDAKQAAYAAWAERMKTHKKSKLADLAVEGDEEVGKRPTTSPYWDTAALFSTAPEEKPTDPALMATKDLLFILELPQDAAAGDLQGAFRRLAKEHHPDRWHDAPAEIRAEHEDRMALITEAHRELRRRDL
jgi:hypothetical protein